MHNPTNTGIDKPQPKHLSLNSGAANFTKCRGQHSATVSILASGTSRPRFNAGVPKKISDEKIVAVAEVNQ